MKILLVEDDPTLNKNISEVLQAEGLLVKVVYDGILAEKLLKNNTFDVVVLDVNLPGKNGFEVCKSFRLWNTQTPVLLLTAFDDIEDKVHGYNAGADDYLTKPFLMRELILRLNALVKRKSNLSKKNQETKIFFDDIVIDLQSKTVFRNSVTIELTFREYQILVKLIEANGDFVSKTDLIETIWGKSFDANTNTIEVYINFLRKKIDKPFDKNTIKTKVGFGYYLER
ncbi:response regulator transcription factor [Flavobacterium sp. J27]|uniref:response regulator transcription factor n=1 Tax=Flavobacterium sp. J27 TaxID=2060419 RepID=UPI00103176C3|nr:response regulator transcription factor [Flavobacterium sp. J27]